MMVTLYKKETGYIIKNLLLNVTYDVWLVNENFEKMKIVLSYGFDNIKLQITYISKKKTFW